jgi:hypothetical protein
MMMENTYQGDMQANSNLQEDQNDALAYGTFQPDQLKHATQPQGYMSGKG